MMGGTYAEVKEHSDKEWQFYRYTIVSEYKTNSPLPPPFNGIVVLFNFLSNKMGVCRDYLISSWRGGYERVPSSSSTPSAQPTQAEPLEINKNILKILKISREKILEQDQSNDNVSLKNISSTSKEQLRLISSLRDSDRKYYEQQIKASEEHYEKQLKKLEENHKEELNTLEQHHEKQLKDSDKKHEQLFAEMLGVLKRIEQQTSKNSDSNEE